jgi:hypothetical protein
LTLFKRSFIVQSLSTELQGNSKMTHTANIKFKGIETSREFKFNGQRFIKTGNISAEFKSGGYMSFNPNSMIELEISADQLALVKTLLNQGEGGTVIGDHLEMNQAEVCAVIESTWD